MKRRVLKFNGSCFFGEVILGRGTKKSRKKDTGEGGGRKGKGRGCHVGTNTMDGWMDG